MRSALSLIQPEFEYDVNSCVFVRLQRALLNYAPRTSDAHVYLRLAMNDILSRPGSLVRAALVLRTAQERGFNERSAEQLACALEYWHIASLLFDDLPCMDDAQTRRGKPCLHLVYGEANTILVALALVNRGYTLIGEAYVETPSAQYQDALSIIDSALGPSGLIGGQSRDLNFKNVVNVAPEIGRIAWQKTGMLFWLAIALPTLASRPSPKELRSLRAVGIYWGLSYQALDDLSDLDEKGPAGNEERPNIVQALGAAAVKRRVQRLLRLALSNISQLESIDEQWSYLMRWHQDTFEARAAQLTQG